MPIFKKPIVFINYRRADSPGAARNLNDNLENAFGRGFVFQDLDDLRAGEIWSEKLIEAGNSSKIILAVIGPKWLQKNESGRSRLFDKEDWVTKELDLAIKAKKIIIPVLVNGAKLPAREDIPESLHDLYAHQYFELRTDKWNIDRDALIKDISAVSGIKTLVEIAKETDNKVKEDKVKASSKKMLWMTISLVVLGILFFGYILWPDDEKNPQGPDITGIGVTDSLGNQGLENGGIETIDFCPDFESNANIRTLLYPLVIEGQEINIGNFIKQKISNICLEHNIQSEVKTPNIEEGKFYDAHDAKRNCSSCTSDIFITGICYAESPTKYGLNANIGFCNPSYQGFDLDQDKLSIQISNYSIADLVSDPGISESFEYTIEIFLGIYQIKKGNLNEGIKIIQKAMTTYPKSKDIEMVARDILWQAQYKLNRKNAASATLDALYKLDPSKTKPLILKSDINFKTKRYQEAIQDLNTIIANKPASNNKDKFLERRGDAYFEVKQYDKAKADYKSIRTIEVGAKINNANNRIIANNTKINDLQVSTNLTDRDKSKLINLHTQNGNYFKASEVFNTITPSKYDTPAKMKAIGIQSSTINALAESDVTLTPAVKLNIINARKINPTNIHN